MSPLVTDMSSGCSLMHTNRAWTLTPYFDGRMAKLSQNQFHKSTLDNTNMNRNERETNFSYKLKATIQSEQSYGSRLFR